MVYGIFGREINTVIHVGNGQPYCWPNSVVKKGKKPMRWYFIARNNSNYNICNSD
jgi:hypothetical protein